MESIGVVSRRWVLLESMGVVSRRWVWVESVSVASGGGCKEVYRFPHITYLYKMLPQYNNLDSCST